MENAFQMALLFDFYSLLLTERQQVVFQMYFHEDLSLGEIGEQLEVSRQAIYDILRRTGIILEDLENKLGLVKKHQERQLLYDNVLKLIETCRDKDTSQIDECLDCIQTQLMEIKTLS